jgi:hypothetical protein
LQEKLVALYRETAGLLTAKSKAIEQEVRYVQRYVYEERNSGRKEQTEKSRLSSHLLYLPFSSSSQNFRSLFLLAGSTHHFPPHFFTPQYNQFSQQLILL